MKRIYTILIFIQALFHYEQGLNEDENWRIVGGEKRRKTEKIDICISSKDQLPKQFALAKLFDSEKISGVNRVKFINAFKVIVSFDDVKSAEKLISCQFFKEKEWRIQKTWEVNVSYGVIRDIDVDLPESELLEYIKSGNGSEILSAKRLNRRNQQSGWLQSETVRICFKGSSLPQYVMIFNVRVKVEPFVFPVTQCSQCWRFGHTLKLCPSLKIICPKCGKNHPNCEATTFRCVNCQGNHMALVKSCPAYIKEKKIRSLMSEFNCTYRRALTMYVPPFSPRANNRYEKFIPMDDNMSRPLYSQTNAMRPMSYAAAVLQNNRDYTNATQSASAVNISNEQRQSCTKRKQRSSSEQLAFEANESSSSESHTADGKRYTRAGARSGTDDKVYRQCRGGVGSVNVDNCIGTTNVPLLVNGHRYNNGLDECNKQSFAENEMDGGGFFGTLWFKIKQIILSKRNNWSEKIKSIISITVEWCISYIMDNFSDVSVFKKMIDFIFNVQNG